MKTRPEIWKDLKHRTECQVLILGGGINGTAVLRELAHQDIDCVLVDKADFVAGASSTSSRMIHGGLRYLENAEYQLVSEAVHERNRSRSLESRRASVLIWSLLSRSIREDRDAGVE